MNKKKLWLYISYGSLTLSFSSMLLPVISYTKGRSRMSFNALELIFRPQDFIRYVMKDYSGDFMFGVDFQNAVFVLILLAILAVTALLLSLGGISRMKKQYESSAPYYMALGGLILNALPAVGLAILLMGSGKYFIGEIRLGLYAFLNPIAMLAACAAVTSRHRLSKAERELIEKASFYIRPAGDLNPRIYGGRQNG